MTKIPVNIVFPMTREEDNARVKAVILQIQDKLATMDLDTSPAVLHSSLIIIVEVNTALNNGLLHYHPITNAPLYSTFEVMEVLREHKTINIIDPSVEPTQ